jgi:WD40 repeat protein
MTCAAFLDAEILVTTALDCTVSVWTLTGSTYGPYDLNLKAGLFGHRAAVNLLLVSSTLSTIVTASIDGQVIIWDVNSLERLRVISHGTKIDCGAIDHRSGKIVLCSGMIAKVYSINGELILEQSLCATLGDQIVCCAHYESTGSEWIGGDFILTGHTKGVAKVSLAYYLES